MLRTSVLFSALALSLMPVASGFWIQKTPDLRASNVHQSLTMLDAPKTRGPIRYIQQRRGHSHGRKRPSTITFVRSAAMDSTLSGSTTSGAISSNIDTMKPWETEPTPYETLKHEVTDVFWEEQDVSEMSFYDDEGRRHVFKTK